MEEHITGPVTSTGWWCFSLKSADEANDHNSCLVFSVTTWNNGQRVSFLVSPPLKLQRINSSRGSPTNDSRMTDSGTNSPRPSPSE